MYKIKKEAKDTIKNKYLIDELEFSNVYVSQLLNRKRVCPKHTAFAIASLYGKKIEELFEKVGE